MKYHLIYLILFFNCYSFWCQQNEIFDTWTNGYEFYKVNKQENNKILFLGGNLHEGGNTFELKQINENSFQFVETNSAIGEKGDYLKLKKINDSKCLLIYNQKNNIKGTLIELNEPLEKIVINNKVNYELAGKYKDKSGKIYTFYPNNLMASGLSNKQNYKFESEYDFPIEVITFGKNKSFYYDRSINKLTLYQAKKNEYGEWEKSDKMFELTKFKSLNHTNKNLNGDYPFCSSEILTSDILNNFEKAELKIMRNEIFARYGYKFKTNKMKKYFESKNWYKGEYDNVNNKLTDLEKINIELIKFFENK